MLTAYGEKTIEYDIVGNPTKWGDDRFAWANGRELALHLCDGVTWAYTYDANGMRTKRSNGTTTYAYVYNGSQFVQMTVGNDTLYFTSDTVTYNGTVYYYVTNLQGDVTAIINSSGALAVLYTYDAWGNILTIDGTMADTLGVLNPLRYRGYVYDQESGLYYLQSRYYDPEIGRFINADGLVSTGQGLLGNNMFAYCGNNPVAYTDPSGHIYVSSIKGDQFYTLVDDLGGGGGGIPIPFVITFPLIKAIATGAENAAEWVESKWAAITEAMALSLARARTREYRSEYEEHHIAARMSRNATQAANILNSVLPGGVENPLNKVMVKTSIHRRIHTNLYYNLVNRYIIAAYEGADGDPRQQYINVVAALTEIRVLIESLNALSIN